MSEPANKIERALYLVHTTPEPRYSADEVLAVSPASHANRLRADIESALRHEFPTKPRNAVSAGPRNTKLPNVVDSQSFTRSVSISFAADDHRPVTRHDKSGLIEWVHIDFAYDFATTEWKWKVTGWWRRVLKSGKLTDGSGIYFAADWDDSASDLPWLHELIRLHRPNTRISFTEN